MIPIKSQNFNNNINIITMPSYTFKINTKNKTISGNISSIKSLAQTIYKILNTPRYKYAIYNWNYGLETYDLFGMPIGYVKAELERRIPDALSIDDRITSVYDFKFFSGSEKGNLIVQFVVSSIFGNLDFEQEVII